MKRENFIKIIKLRSFWKIDKRRGNYELPSGARLNTYIEMLVDTQMELDDLGIRENGDLCTCTGGKWNPETKEFDDFIITIPFGENEVCTYGEMERRRDALIREIIY